MTAINLPAKEESYAPEAEVLPPEENTLVNQFIDRSQTIIPGLQVTLAKRVVMPGSRRVLCMAAHTSVPISDNELSSVSELALRLSDGTSCLLSLKFFNDTMDGGFTNANPFIYDPQRYETVHGQSNLGVAILATAFVAITGYYYAISNSVMANMHASHTPVIHKSASHSVIATPKVVQSSAAPPKNLVPEAKVAPARATNAKTSVVKTSVAHKSSSSHAKTNYSEYAEPARSSGFVPPPPPMPVSPLPYNPAMSFPFYMPNSMQPPAAKRSLEVAKPKVIEQVTPKITEVTPKVMEATAKPVVKESPVAPKRVEPVIERIQTTSEISSAEAAPAPGEPLHLERIVIPNQ
jgi:hypothetical protein